AGGGPSLVAPPQDLHVITLAGRPQARDLAASASAVQCVAPVRPYHLDTTARPGVSFDPLAHGISAGHPAPPPPHGSPPPPRHPRGGGGELRSARAWHERRPSCPPAPAWVAPSRAAAKAEADAM